MAPGWMLQFHKLSKDGSAKCNITKAPASVFFAVFDIDDSEKQLLDRAEGLGHGYIEKQIVIEGFGQCFVYAASKSHIENDLTPYSWYKELVIVGLEHHLAPLDYLEKVRAIPSCFDSDSKRHREHMQIVEIARNGA